MNQSHWSTIDYSTVRYYCSTSFHPADPDSTLECVACGINTWFNVSLFVNASDIDTIPADCTKEPVALTFKPSDPTQGGVCAQISTISETPEEGERGSKSCRKSSYPGGFFARLYITKCLARPSIVHTGPKKHRLCRAAKRGKIFVFPGDKNLQSMLSFVCQNSLFVLPPPNRLSPRRGQLWDTSSCDVAHAAVHLWACFFTPEVGVLKHMHEPRKTFK
jgi:hypothetical protein